MQFSAIWGDDCHGVSCMGWWMLDAGCWIMDFGYWHWNNDWAAVASHSSTAEHWGTLWKRRIKYGHIGWLCSKQRTQSGRFNRPGDPAEQLRKSAERLSWKEYVSA